MSGKKEVIQLKKVAKHYHLGENIVRALDGIDILINEGEFVSIMGPSGSGKSTAMNLVGSLDAPTHGKIFLDKKDISKFSESDLAQLRGKKIGFIFQQFNLINNLTARENIALPMMFQGASESERLKKADELLKMVDLGDRGSHYPNQLSGGQQQRVAIARSLANDPEVILADEPTGNLDTKTGQIIVSFLENLHKKGKTIVMVTHDPALAQKYSDVVYWLRDGKVEKITKKRRK
ncbi:hypothetical protein CMI41_01420 [Candidatus Pacearchaeota archaeon]|nr:hypothetical protein [Candidatus Pacearchaeota archaeon]|tara:strand:- start:3898 stop:4602 length:705 start_codon:yes stop_codon:yes gene_type:complete